MGQTKNPAGANRQGFENGTAVAANSKIEAITTTVTYQPQFDIVQFFARRTGIAAPTVRMHVELFGVGAPR